MIVSHTIKPFRKNGIVLDEALWINGIPYFTRSAIGKFLELKKGSEGVDTIVRRNPVIRQYSKTITVLSEEIIPNSNEGDCIPPKLGGLCPMNDPEIIDIIKKKGGQSYYKCLKCLDKVKPKTRTRKIDITVYHPIGMQLILLESNTPKAKEYKHRVAQLLWMLIETGMVEPDLEQIEAEKILEMAIIADHGQKRNYINEYQKKTGCCKATAFNHLNLLKKGVHPGERKKKSPHKNLLIQGELELKIRRMVLENPAIGAKAIYSQLGKPTAPSYSTIKKYVKKLKAEKSE